MNHSASMVVFRGMVHSFCVVAFTGVVHFPPLVVVIGNGSLSDFGCRCWTWFTFFVVDSRCVVHFPIMVGLDDVVHLLSVVVLVRLVLTPLLSTRYADAPASPPGTSEQPADPLSTAMRYTDRTGIS